MISVIIPACNEEKYLKETIDSVKSESVEHEVIVASDASTDDTDKIGMKYADKFVRLAKRSGPAGAKNAGARVAKGEILVFLDADTRLTKGVLEEIKKVTKDNVVGTCKIIPAEKNLKHRIAMSFKNTFICPFGVSNGIVFCTKETFEKYGEYAAVKKQEDGFFVRKVKKEGNFIVIKTPVISSMRRFEKLGYLGVGRYWLKESVKPSNEDYPVIR